MPAIVIHGGFWRVEYGLDHIGHLCRELARQGIASWSLEYRRVGNPGGGWPNTFRDVVSGFKAARVRFADPANVVVIGHSAGGHLALRLAFDELAFRRFSVQPMDGPERARNTEFAIRFCLEHPKWRLSLQTHKFLGIP